MSSLTFEELFPPALRGRLRNPNTGVLYLYKHSGSRYPLLFKGHNCKTPMQILKLPSHPQYRFFPSYLPGSEPILIQPTGAVVNKTGNSSHSTQATSTRSSCVCPVLASTPTASLTQPQLGLLKVAWTGQCDGVVNLLLYRDLPSSPVCHNSDVSRLLKTVCIERKGCKGAPSWHQGRTPVTGYRIEETGIEQMLTCDSLQVQCSGRSTSTNGMV